MITLVKEHSESLRQLETVLAKKCDKIEIYEDKLFEKISQGNEYETNLLALRFNDEVLNKKIQYEK